VHLFLALPREERLKGCIVQNEATGAGHGERLRKFLPRIQLDDELFVDDRLHFLAGRDVRDLAAERVAIRCQPVRHGGNLSELEIAKDELTRLRLVLDRDFVAGLYVIGSNIDAAPIHEHMAMRHELPGSAACIGKAKAVDDVIQSRLQKLEKGLTCYAALAQRVLKNPPKLALEKSVLITKLLLFPKCNCILGLFTSGALRAVHARRIVFPLQRFGEAKERHAITAADFRFRSGVSTH